MIPSCHPSRNRLSLVSLIWFVVLALIVGLPPDVEPGRNTVASVEEWNQELPRTAAFEDNKVLSCYAAYWSIEFPDPDVYCTMITSNGTHLAAGPMQPAASDATLPEVHQVATAKALLCFQRKSNNHAFCKFLTYASGFLNANAKPVRLSNTSSDITVRPAIVQTGSNLAVACFRGVFVSQGGSTVSSCMLLDTGGSDLIKSSALSSEIFINEHTTQLALAPVGPSSRLRRRLSSAPSTKAMLCYVVDTVEGALKCMAIDTQGGSITGGAALEVEASGATQISIAQSDSDTVVLCYKLSGLASCRALQVSGVTVTLEGSLETVYAQALNDVKYPPSVVRVSENVFTVCYVVAGTHRSMCRALNNLGGNGIEQTELSTAVDIGTGGASFMSMARLNSDLAILCWQDQDTSDKPINCRSVAYPSSCAAPAGIAEAPTPCSEGNSIFHGSSCTAQCFLGYDPTRASLECSHGVFYPSTFACSPKPCNTLVPPHGGLGDCGATLASGGSCQPTCKAGYTPSGRMSCNLGNLVDVTCQPASCNNYTAPANGGLGDCTPTLASGEFCIPICDEGYTLSGNFTCSLGLVTQAECFEVPPVPPKPSPDPPDKAPVVISSSVGGSILLCCLCICGCICRKDKNKHGKTMFKKAMSGKVDAAYHEWTGLLHDLSGFGGQVYFDLDGDLKPKMYGHRISVSGPDITTKPSKPELTALKAFHSKYEKFRKEIIAESRCIVLFSHDAAQNDVVWTGVDFITESYALDGVIYRAADTTEPMWRWHWMVGATISRKIVCVVSKEYLQNAHRCNEYVTARKTKSAITLLMFEKEDVKKVKSDPAEISEHIQTDGSLVEFLEFAKQGGDGDVDHTDEAMEKVMGDLLSGRRALVLKLKRKQKQKTVTKKILRLSQSVGAVSSGKYKLRNDENAIVKPGVQTSEEGNEIFYCGRNLGVDAIPGSDGRCGPANGPQCASCQRFQNKSYEKDETTGEPWWKKYYDAGVEVAHEAVEVNSFQGVIGVTQDALNVGEGAICEAIQRAEQPNRASVSSSDTPPTKTPAKKKVIKRKVPKRGSAVPKGDDNEEEEGMKDDGIKDDPSQNLLSD